MVLLGAREYSLLPGDCLEVMWALPEASVDLVLSDPPYGMTYCPWDRPLPFEVMWHHYERLVKPRGAVVLTASQPFTTRLASSRPGWFRYEWIWDKVTRATGFQLAKKRPLKRHENVLVFYRRQPTYNPQMGKGKAYVSKRGAQSWAGFNSKIAGTTTVNRGERYPTSILRIPSPGHAERGQHPTQKPVELMEYLVRTYTDPGDVVLDNCMGSGTTGVACVRSGRRFVGIELDRGFLTTARRRLRDESSRLRRLGTPPPAPAGGDSTTAP